MSTKRLNSRRDFLRTLTTAVGGTATLAAASTMVQAAPVEAPKQAEAKPESKGYQRTQHVDTYYQLADF